jgi:hypothetical protein
VEARSRLAAEEVLQLTDPHNNRAAPLPLSSRARCTTPPSCLVFRLPEGKSSYIEMVHPLDFVETNLEPHADGFIRCTTRVFRGRLEKGVILRSRLRAMIVPRKDDIETAATCYRDFACSEPPLTV